MIRRRGKEKGITLKWRAGEYTIDLLPKLKIEVLVLAEALRQVIWLLT
ncbi:P-II family nitrogen regulator [Chloroflexota bacterium]